MSAVADIAPDLFDLMAAALGGLSEQQRRVYELTHGIDEHGQAEHGEMELQQVADLLGVSRGAARWHLAQAERTVYRTIALSLYHAERSRLEAEEMPTPGEAMPHLAGKVEADPEPGDNLRVRGRARHGSTGLVLGAGSELHVREAKRSDAKGRTAALIAAHQECVGVLA